MAQEEEKSVCRFCLEACGATGSFACRECSQRSHEACWFEWMFKSLDNVIKCQGCIRVLEHLKPMRRQIVDALDRVGNLSFDQAVEELDQVWIHLMPLDESLDKVQEAAIFVRMLRLWSQFLAESSDESLRARPSSWMLGIVGTVGYDVLEHPEVQRLVRIARRSLLLEGCPFTELPSRELLGGASSILGCIFSDHESPNLDLSLAMTLFRRSADEGHPSAIFRIAIALEKKCLSGKFLRPEHEWQELLHELTALCESPLFQQADHDLLVGQGVRSLLAGLHTIGAFRRLSPLRSLLVFNFEALREHEVGNETRVLALLAWEAFPETAALLPVVTQCLQSGEAAAHHGLGQVYADERLWEQVEYWGSRARLERAADHFQQARCQVPDAALDLVPVLMDLGLLEAKRVGEEERRSESRLLERLEKVMTLESALLGALDQGKRAKATLDFLLAFFLVELHESHGWEKWTRDQRQDLWRRVEGLRSPDSLMLAAALAWAVNPARALGHPILHPVLKLDQVLNLLLCDSNWYQFLSDITGGKHHLVQAASHCTALPAEAASRARVAQALLQRALELFHKERAVDSEHVMQSFFKLTTPAAKACALSASNEHPFLCAVLVGHYLMGQLQKAKSSPDTFKWDIEERKCKQLFALPATFHGEEEDHRLKLRVVAVLAWDQRPAEVTELPAARMALRFPTDVGTWRALVLDFLAALLAAPLPEISEFQDQERAGELYREAKACPDPGQVFAFCMHNIALHRALRLLKVPSSFLEGRRCLDKLFGFPHVTLQVSGLEIGDFVHVEEVLWQQVAQGAPSATTLAAWWMKPMLGRAVDLFHRDGIDECQEHLRRLLALVGPCAKLTFNLEDLEEEIACGFYTGHYLLGRCEAAQRALDAFHWASEQRKAQQTASGFSLRVHAALAWSQRPAAVPAFHERHAARLLARIFAGLHPFSEFMDQDVAEQWHQAAKQAPGQDDGGDVFFLHHVLVQKALRLFKEKSMPECQECLTELMALNRGGLSAMWSSQDHSELVAQISKDLLLGRYLQATAHLDGHLVKQRLDFLQAPPQRLGQPERVLPALVWDVDEAMASSLPNLLKLEKGTADTSLLLLKLFATEPLFRDMERALLQVTRLREEPRALVQAAIILCERACEDFEGKSLKSCRESLELLRNIEELLQDEDLQIADLKSFLLGSWLSKELHQAPSDMVQETLRCLRALSGAELLQAFYGLTNKVTLRATPPHFTPGADAYVDGHVRCPDAYALVSYKRSMMEGHPLAMFALALRLATSASMHLEKSSFQDCRWCLQELQNLAQLPQPVFELKTDEGPVHAGCRALLLGIYMPQLLQEVEAVPSTINSALRRLKWLCSPVEAQSRLRVLFALAWRASPDATIKLPFVELEGTEAKIHHDLGCIFAGIWPSLDLFCFKDLDKGKEHLHLARDEVPLAGFKLAQVLQREALGLLFQEQNFQKALQTLQELCDLGRSLQTQEEDMGNEIYIQGAEALLLAEYFVALSSAAAPEAFDLPLASRRWSWLHSSQMPMTKLQALAALAWGMVPERVQELPPAVQSLKLQQGTAEADFLAGLICSYQDANSNPFFDLQKAVKHLRRAAEVGRPLAKEELSRLGEDLDNLQEEEVAPEGRVNSEEPSASAEAPPPGTGSKEPSTVEEPEIPNSEDLVDVEDPAVQLAAWQSLQAQNPVEAVLNDPVQRREQQLVLCQCAREDAEAPPANVRLFLLQFQRHSQEFQRRLHEGPELQHIREALTAAGHDFVLTDFFQVKVFVHPSQYTTAVHLLKQRYSSGLFPRHVVVTETLLELLLNALRGCPGAKEKSNRRVLLGEVAPPPPESEGTSEQTGGLQPIPPTTDELLHANGVQCFHPEVRNLTQMRPSKKSPVTKSCGGSSLRGHQADFELLGLRSAGQSNAGSSAGELPEEDGRPGRLCLAALEGLPGSSFSVTWPAQQDAEVRGPEADCEKMD